MPGDGTAAKRRLATFFSDRMRVAAALVILLVGAILLLLSELENKHHTLSVALGDAGSLLAGSVALAVVYDIFVKPAHEDETLAAVDRKVWEPLASALERHETALASLVDSLTEPIATVERNQERLLDQRVDVAIPGAVSGGFLGVLPKLDFADRVFGTLGEGDELMWLDTYCPTLRSAEDALFAAVIKGATIRMLAIDPEAPNCAARSEEIEDARFSEQIFRNEARAGLELLRSHAESYTSQHAHGSIEIRLYRGLPCAPMYLRRLQGVLTVGYTSYFLTRATYDEPHVVWGPVSSSIEGFLERLERYFTRRWDLASRSDKDLYLRWPSQKEDLTSPS